MDTDTVGKSMPIVGGITNSPGYRSAIGRQNRPPTPGHNINTNLKRDGSAELKKKKKQRNNNGH